MTAFVIIDVETSGIDPEQDELLEVGAVLFDAKHGAIAETFSYLLAADDNPAEAINRIPAALLRDELLCNSSARAVMRIEEMLKAATADPGGAYVLAHKAAFDRAWLPALDDQRWICTKEDADWPRSDREGPSLVHLALAYDVGVVRAHRAIEDCLTLAAVLSRVHAIEGGLHDWLARALEPRREVRALVSYEDRQLAKDAGFSWDPQRKWWVKRVRESKLEAFGQELPFRVQEAS